MNGYPDLTQWHRRLCPVTDGIIISGDLPQDPDRAIQQLKRWEQAGITHVLDTRFEWSDEEFVAKHAPDIVYGWIGTDDDGDTKPDEWFDAGLDFNSEALSDPNAVVLVHCNMGQRAEREAERSARIASMEHTDANRAAHELATGKSIPWMGPVSTPREESIAVEAARTVSIDAARRRRTTTCGELRVAADDSTGMRIGHRRFAESAMSVIRSG